MTNKDGRAGIKDVWNAKMCEGACYSNSDIPYCPTIISDYPTKIVTWSEALSLHSKKFKEDKKYMFDAFVCFYIDDYKFDGLRSSIWSYPLTAYNILKHFKGIITPDFSTYQDFPMPLKIWNTFRMRAFGFWAGKQGLEVINNVRWGTPETYKYCFDGIPKNSVVAIGTVGGSPKKLIDRRRFNEGLKEMMKRIMPQTIIVYGSSKYQCFEDLKQQGVRIISFQSSTAAYFEGRRCNE